jgi:murein DD-endopeptidase MepM/ murein hydrolase activator NlpD
MLYGIFLTISLLLPQTLMGLVPAEKIEDVYYEETQSAVQFFVTGSYAEIDRESWLLDIQYPVANHTSTSSGWGARYVRDCPRCSTFHQGVDFTPGRGSNVYAAMDGVVSVSDIGGEYGVYVILDHQINEDLIYQTVYAHLKRNKLTTNLYPGQKVSKGDIIGYVGNTGLSTGPHLHFEIRINGRNVDPMRILEQNIVETK